MLAPTVILFLVHTFFAEQASSQCIGAYTGYAEGIYGAAPYTAAYTPWEVAAPYATTPCIEHAVAYNPAALSASHGPGLAVTSASPVAPAGVAAVSETVYNGGLAVTGQVPFVSAVTLEGALPTIGAGAITYNCGNGNVAILREDSAPAYAYAAPYEYAAPYGYGAVAAGPAYGYGPVAAGPAYGYGGGYACGCGVHY